MSQENIKKKLEEANKEYRLTGECSMTDAEYDCLMDQIRDDDFRSRVGVKTEKNKIKLPVAMGSMEKIKVESEISHWQKKKNISDNKLLTLTPKFDGLSLLVEYVHGEFVGAYTRGDGIYGQDVTEHFKFTKIGKNILPDSFTGFLIGEAIMSDLTFKKKYSKDYKNPRNMVAGVIGRKTIQDELYDIDFMAFTLRNEEGGRHKTRTEEVAWLNEFNNKLLFGYEIPSPHYTMGNLIKENLNALSELSKPYQCDGVVIEVDEIAEHDEIGLETNSLNPGFARAWKPESDNKKTTIVKNVKWQVSKYGLQKPVVEVEPVELCGVTISNVTGNNAKYIKDHEIQKGTVVTIIRSGDVIPKIVGVNSVDDFEGLPCYCDCCDEPVYWTDTSTDLVCVSENCLEKKIGKVISFFETIDADELREGTIRSLFDEGFETLEDICNMTVDHFMTVEGFKKRKSENCYNAIQNKLNLDIEVYQHASCLFDGLGSSKLKHLNKYSTPNNKPTLEDILAIDGFAETSAKAYLKSIDEFWDLTSRLPFKINEVVDVSDGALKDVTFVFTGYRNKDLEKEIVAQGGKVGSSVSKKTNYLVVKAKGSGSSKEKKALELGIKILEGSEAVMLIGMGA